MEIDPLNIVAAAEARSIERLLQPLFRERTISAEPSGEFEIIE
jgi:hypothetical protein